MEYSNTEVIAPTINDEKVIYLNAREESLNQRELRLNVQAQAVETFKNTLLEAVQSLFTDVVLVEKSALESLLSEVEEAKENASSAQEMAESLSREAENIASYADDAQSSADSAYNSLRDIINGIS